MNLASLKQKYGIDSAKYEPKPDCKFCKGTGEKFAKHRNDYTFCICLFVNHDASDDVGEMLGSFAKNELEKLRRGKDGKSI